MAASCFGWAVPKMTTLERFEVFCPKVFAGIGAALPDTIADRSVAIGLQRRTREEQVERFRRREVGPDAENLHSAIADWVTPQLDALHDVRPHLPDELDDRAQDVWEPLLAIAGDRGRRVAGEGEWAALELSTGEAREDESITAKLIRDIHSVFTETGWADPYRRLDRQAGADRGVTVGRLVREAD